MKITFNNLKKLINESHSEDELFNFIINDSFGGYNYSNAQKVIDILKNKISTDEYNVEDAIKLWKKVVDKAAKHYNYKYGGRRFEDFEKCEVVKRLEEYYYDEMTE